MSACMGAEVFAPARSKAMVWLERAPSRLVTTVEVVGELVSPSKTTTPGRLAASGAYTITRCPAVTRSPGFRISRAFSGMLLTKVPFLLPRSCTVQSSPSASNAKCCRERPASSGKQSLAALERPIDRRSPVSATVFICPSGHWMRSSRDMVVLGIGDKLPLETHCSAAFSGCNAPIRGGIPPSFPVPPLRSGSSHAIGSKPSVTLLRSASQSVGSTPCLWPLRNSTASNPAASRRHAPVLTPELQQFVKISRGFVATPGRANGGAQNDAFQRRVRLERVDGFRHPGADLGLELGVEPAWRNVVSIAQEPDRPNPRVRQQAGQRGWSFRPAGLQNEPLRVERVGQGDGIGIGGVHQDGGILGTGFAQNPGGDFLHRQGVLFVAKAGLMEVAPDAG